jgi:hypothetical protein
LAQQIALQIALTGFNGANMMVQNLDADLPENDPESNDDNKMTDLLGELQGLMTGRTAYIGAIDRLILRRGARANSASALAYLQRRRTEQNRLLLAEQTRHANLTAVLAATANQPAAGADDTEAPAEDEEPAVLPQNRDDQPPVGGASAPQQNENRGTGASESPELVLSPTAPYQDPEGQRRGEGRLKDRWVSVMTLDPGSTGIPQVWVKRNSHNMITDVRRLEHDGKCLLTSPSDWLSSLVHLSPPMTDRASGKETTPLSKCLPYLLSPRLIADRDRAIAMLRLKSRLGSDRIVRLRNWRLGSEPYENVRRKRVRNLVLYMEYCGVGDLFNLCLAQSTPNTHHFPEVSPGPEKLQRFQLTFRMQPFVWSVFEDLVIAGLLLERGDLDPIAVAPGWDLIVHRDIKLGNGQSVLTLKTLRMETDHADPI